MSDKSLDITAVIKKQELLDKYLLSDLEKLVKKYPFSSTFQVLYLKKLQLENKKYLERLPGSAVYVNDRKRLFEIIFGNDISTPTPKPVKSKKTEVKVKKQKPSTKKKTAKQKTTAPKRIKNTKKKATLKAQKKSTLTKKTPKTTSIAKALGKAKKKVPVAKKPTTKKTTVKPKVSKKPVKKIKKKAIRKKISKVVKKASKQVKKSKPIKKAKKTTPTKPKPALPPKKRTATKPKKKNLNKSVPAAINNTVSHTQSAKVSDKAPFLQWLDTFNQNKQYSVKELEANYASAVYNIDNLANATSEEINQFLKQEINKKKQKNKKNKKIAVNKRAKASIQNNKKNITETLANIYVKQKKYDKAIEIYKSLNLKYPEKNTYFANKMKQIRGLKK